MERLIILGDEAILQDEDGIYHPASREDLIAEIQKLRGYVGDPQACSCCGEKFEPWDLVPEEGDRFECEPCWNKENARERAAHSAEASRP